jgi:hypothetical protein
MGRYPQDVFHYLAGPGKDLVVDALVGITQPGPPLVPGRNKGIVDMPLSKRNKVFPLAENSELVQNRID